MYIFLRDPIHDLIYAAPGRWTRSFEEARMFENSDEAYRFARAHQLFGVEVFHHTPANPEWDYSISAFNPVPPAGQSYRVSAGL